MASHPGEPDRLDIVSRIPAGRRLLLGLLSVVPLLAPYGLTLGIEWTDNAWNRF